MSKVTPLGVVPRQTFIGDLRTQNEESDYRDWIIFRTLKRQAIHYAPKPDHMEAYMIWLKFYNGLLGRCLKGNFNTIFARWAFTDYDDCAPNGMQVKQAE